MPAEKFSSHVPTLVGTALASVLAATLGSFFGISGTLIGLLTASLASGTFSWWIERGVRKSTDLARTKAKVIKARGGKALTVEETQRIERVIDERHRRLGIPWRRIAVISGTVLAMATIAVASWQLIGKPLAAKVAPPAPARTTPAHHHHRQPRIDTPAPEPTVTITTIAPAATGTPAITPATASPTAASPTPSPSPTVTPTPTSVPSTPPPR